MPTPKKTKFGRIFTKDDESSYRSTVEMDLGTILIGPISLKYSTISLTFPNFFKSKEMEESLVEVKREESPVDSQRVITIDSFE